MVGGRILLFAALVALAFEGVRAESDESLTCVFDTLAFTTYDEMMQCFYSIPVNLDVKNQTITSLQRALELYTFLDIASDSPDPNLPVHIDMVKGLQEVADRVHRYDYDVHDDLRGLFLLLNDAHTQYYGPSCYGQFSVRQPFAPISYSDPEAGGQKIAVSPYFSADLVLHYQETMGIDIKQYAEAVIESIDGQPALEFFIEYGNYSVGVSKDLGTRFNMALTRPEPRPDMVRVALGYWQVRTRRNPMPKKPVVDYLFVFPNGTKQALSVPWSVRPLKNYTGIDSFMNDYWASNSKLDLDSEDASDAIPPIDEQYYEKNLVLADSAKHLKHQFRSKTELPLNSDDAVFNILANGTQLSFWELNDNETLVMYLDTFGPSSLIETYSLLNKGFELAAERNLSQLIIDLTNNGGGSICLGRSLIAYLQPNGTNYGPEDLACSPLQQQLTEQAVALNVTDTVWSPSFYANHNDDQIAWNDTSYLIPGVPHVRGGKLRNYTKLVHIDSCGDFGYRISPAIEFAPQEMLILTHGYCGSTCSLFSTHLALYDNVRTVVFGGIDGREQQFFSFPGGQVLDTPYLFQVLESLGMNTTASSYIPGELQPRALPTSASYRFCVREVYPNDRAYSTNPMEFSFKPGSYRIPYSYQTAVAPEYGWYEAAAHFGPAPPAPAV